MTYNQQLKKKRKEQIEEEKFNALFKTYIGIGALVLMEDCGLSNKTIEKYRTGFEKKFNKYFSTQDGLDKLAKDLLQAGIKVLNINCDENQEVYPQYKQYWNAEEFE